MNADRNHLQPCQSSPAPTTEALDIACTQHLTPFVKQSLVRDYLLLKLGQAEKGVESARLWLEGGATPGAERQLEHWTRVVAAIKWCLSGVTVIK